MDSETKRFVMVACLLIGGVLMAALPSDEQPTLRYRVCAGIGELALGVVIGLGLSSVRF